MKPLEKPVTRSELEAHAQTLGLSDIDTLTEDQVRAAYRKLLFASHPDTSEGDAALSVLSLRYIKDTLLAWIAERPKLGCAVCGGTGYVSAGGFRIQPCYRCGV